MQSRSYSYSMISTQPIQLWKYLCLRRAKQPGSIKQLFYLSWEDALWDLLLKKRIPRGSIVMVPSFFCVDVENNIRAHGYTVTHYPVNNNLTVDVHSFEHLLDVYKPLVVIVFHAVGMYNKLFDSPRWMDKMDTRALLIEDSVHRILNPMNLVLRRPNHFIIDSLRKVIPMQGSRLFGSNTDLDFSSPPASQSFQYAFEVTLLWMRMNILWNLCQFFSGTRISVLFARCAERLMLRGYDRIGDALLSARGCYLFEALLPYLNFDKIYAVKNQQVAFYEKELDSIIPVKLPYKDSDRQELRGWPIVLPLTVAEPVLHYLRSHGLFVRFELDDCLWSARQKIIYLPLGLHMSEKKQTLICKLVKEALLCQKG